MPRNTGLRVISVGSSRGRPNLFRPPPGATWLVYSVGLLEDRRHGRRWYGGGTAIAGGPGDDAWVLMIHTGGPSRFLGEIFGGTQWRPESLAVLVEDLGRSIGSSDPLPATMSERRMLLAILGIIGSRRVQEGMAMLKGRKW